MTNLVRYNAARRALAAARRFDEIKPICDKAIGLEVYARQAKDTELLGHAVDVRLEAERRASELLRAENRRMNDSLLQPTTCRPVADETGASRARAVK
jgi:hypothetical protein